MDSPGRILIADDEETFLRSMADLLCEEGYECTCASDGVEAEEMLRKEEHDLLIADIRMPGNLELELIKELPQIAEGVPVILVTAYPSLGSAIQSLQLPVVSYFVKPIEFDQLLEQVRTSVRKCRASRILRSMEQRFQDWRKCLADTAEAAKLQRHRASPVSVEAFLSVTLGNIASSLSDMKHLIETLVHPEAEQLPCNLMNCPRLSELEDALAETIDVLEKTRGAFKSKRLGRLRSKLEELAFGNKA